MEKKQANKLKKKGYEKMEYNSYYEMMTNYEQLYYLCERTEFDELYCTNFKVYAYGDRHTNIFISYAAIFVREYVDFEVFDYMERVRIKGDYFDTLIMGENGKYIIELYNENYIKLFKFKGAC